MGDFAETVVDIMQDHANCNCVIFYHSLVSENLDSQKKGDTDVKQKMLSKNNTVLTLHWKYQCELMEYLAIQ